MSDNHSATLISFPLKRCPVPGFTLVELLVAVACMALLLGPVIWVYQSGSKTALEGRVKVEITLEARNVLRQVHDDLKYSVFFCDYAAYSSDVTIYFPGMLGGDKAETYVLWRFPLHGRVEDAIEPSGSATAFRIPVKITYALVKENPDSPFYCLYRQEGTRMRTLLSRRVNFFEIQENSYAPARTSWLITLQLAELVKPLAEDANFEKLQETQDRSVKKLERRLVERSRGVQIADFFDVVASEYYVFAGKTFALFSWPTLLKNGAGGP